MAPVIRGNSLYTIVDGPSWTQAETNARSIGGNLAGINDASENTFIYENFGPETQNGHRGGLWIGYFTPTIKTQWQWANTDATLYTNWISGQGLIEDYSGYIGNNRAVDGQYVHMLGPYSNQVGFLTGELGQWNDFPNNPTKDIQWGAQYELNLGIAETPFIRRGDSAYVIVSGPTWAEAEANAVKLGGHLVTINDSEEQMHIDKVLETTTPEKLYKDPYYSGFTLKNYGVPFWIGINDTKIEGTWSWTSGQESNYRAWYPGGTILGNANPRFDDFETDFGYIMSNLTLWRISSTGIAQFGIAEIKLTPNNTPTGTPTVTGTLKVGSTLTIDATAINDSDNFTGYTPTLKYNWETSTDGTTWSKLTTTDAVDNNNTYILTASEVGKKIRGVFSYLDGYGTNEVVNSAMSIAIQTVTPTYTLTPSAASINEGATLNTSIETTDVASGTTLYYSLSGTGINSTDFSSGALTGSGTVASNGSFAFSHTLANDLTTEGTETLNIKLFSDSSRSTQVGSTALVSINDNSTTPLLNQVIASSFEGSEGDWVTVKFRREGDISQYAGLLIQSMSFTTPKHPSDTISSIYPYENHGGWHGDWGLDQASSIQGRRDLVFNPGSSEAEFKVLLYKDDYKEQTERLNFSVYDLGDGYQNRSYNGKYLQKISIKGETYIDIFDNSPTYILSLSTSSINEGSTLTTSIATTNVASGTTLYYSLSGTGITSADFSSGALTGSGSVGSNGTFSFSHTLANDLTTEGTETLNIKLFSDSSRSTQVGSTASVAIADTSIPPAIFSVAGTIVTEGSAANILITRSGNTAIPVDLNVFTSNNNATAGLDYTSISSVLSFNSGETLKSVSINTIDDSSVESSETFNVFISSTNANASISTQSAGVTILDNDFNPIYSITSSSTSTTEGASLTTTINTTYVPNGTTLYWSLSGSGITGSDFSSGSLSDSANTGSDGKITFSHTFANDLTTEGAEILNIILYKDSNRSQQIASTAIFISDTSIAPASGINITGGNSGIANTGTINNNGSINTGTVNTNSGNTTNTNNVTNVTNNYVYYNSNNTTTNTNSGNTLNTWNTFWVDNSIKAGDIVNQWFGVETPIALQTQDPTDTKLLDITTSSWAEKVKINRVAKASDKGDVIEGKQKESGSTDIVGSVLTGGKGNDRIQAMAGWDMVDGGDGDDLVKTGNGRDILTGGTGRDELWGGFGWNTYKGDKDNFSDLIVIKSDQHLANPTLGNKSGNNSDGSKTDIIENLDSIDKIIIQGVSTNQITFANASAQGLTGIGIYSKGFIEALYTGGDLNIAQLTSMTTGDTSAAVLNNTLTSYGVW